MYRWNFKKGARRVAAAVAAFAFLLLAALAFPPEVQAYAFYTTENYDVTLDVHEDNTISVTEEITIDAFDSMHGIYRYIPIRGEAYFAADGGAQGAADGETQAASGEGVQTASGAVQTVSRQMTIRHVNVDGYEFETEQEDGNLVIRIGSADTYITGRQTYRITYDCTLYEDTLPDRDFLYFNAIPTGWETSIDHASVTVHMPKAFESGKAWIYQDHYGQSGDAGAPAIDGNTLTFEADDLLQGEGITVQLDLPQGYFVGAANFDFAIPLLYGVLLLLLLCAAALWYFFGRDPHVVQTVEFYPPEDMTPADAGYLLDGAADKEDLVSMVLYFADRGYLSIEEKKVSKTGIPGLLGKEESVFYLNKEKELPKTERVFAATLFDGLFETKDRVELSELSEDFYAHYEAARTELAAYYGAEQKQRVYTRSSRAARVFGYLLLLLPVSLAAYLCGLASYRFEAGFAGIPLAILAWIGYFIVTVAYDKRHVYSKAKVCALNVVGALIAAIFSFVAVCLSAALFSRVLPMAAAVAVTFIIGFFVRIMHRRTERSAALLGRLLGFKEFIRAAEKDRIETLAEDDPAYFYSILPYAYVFGLSDVWAEKFESIAVAPPSWYRGESTGGMWNTYIFMHSFHSCADAMTQNLTVPPASGGGSSGGFSGGGGGGFSGGGFGGGGGGGW